MLRGGALEGYGRTLVLAMMVICLAGCDLLSNARFLERFRRQSQPQDTTILSEQAIGKLAKGERLQAQTLFDRALQENPRDIYAILGKGIIFQQTGQLTQARAAFQAVLALQPSNEQKLVVMNNLQPRTVRELASMNLALLQGHGLSNSLAGEQTKFRELRQNPALIPGATGGRQRRVLAKRPQSAADLSMVSTGDRNIIARFKILQKLRDQGLMTPEEYDARRKANLGALLSLTQPPPSVGLERSVPSAELVIQRLHAISRALELRAITVRQHSAERKTIVDGLLPENPPNRAAPVPAPKGLLASADAIRRIEMLNENGLITSQEAAAERAAIEKSLTRYKEPPKRKLAVIKKKRKVAPAGPKPAVHIASFRSRKAADRGWTQLRRAHRKLLGTLNPEITQVNLGGKKGVFFRLVAGPVESNAEADRICRNLKRRRQYCEPAFMAGG